MKRIAPVLLLVPALALAQGGPPAAMATPVEAQAVQVRALDETLATVGSLRADEAVLLRPEIAGRIERIHFVDGESVLAQAPLFSLDAALLQAEVNEAAANLDRTRRAFTRAQELTERKLLAGAEFDTAKADLGVDQARLASARTRLDKTIIRAPFAGVVGLRQVSPGDYVSVGQTLVNVVQLDPMQVDFRVPEVHMGRILPGMVVRVRVDAHAERVFAGEVTAIDPQLDPAGRSAQVRARLSNAEGLLRPGMFARVDVVLAGKPQALMVAEQALWPIGEKQNVFRVEDGTARLVEVRLGQRLAGWAEIVAGLAPGDVVVTAGQHKLRDGAPVQVQQVDP